jgi:hypothetical protein
MGCPDLNLPLLGVVAAAGNWGRCRRAEVQMNISRIGLDELNDAELERVSVLIAMRKQIRVLNEQGENYTRAHNRRMDALGAEIATMERRLRELLAGGAS